MKVFCVSDIHGHYTELINCLNKAGYDENNENHLLVVLGDLFDRGTESKKVFNYLYRLSFNNKAVICRGNHDMMFQEFLDGRDSWFNFIHNGMNKTFDDFLDDTASFETYVMYEQHKKGLDFDIRKVSEDEFNTYWNEYQKNTRDKIMNDFPYIVDWFKSLPNYYETKNYIMTHGSIDTNVEDWRKPQKQRYRYVGWDACHWDDGSFFDEDVHNTDKKIIVGHYNTDSIREMYMYDLKNKGDNDILISEDSRKIYIDACTIVSKRVNVYVFEDELL